MIPLPVTDTIWTGLRHPPSPQPGISIGPRPRPSRKGQQALVSGIPDLLGQTPSKTSRQLPAGADVSVLLECEREGNQHFPLSLAFPLAFILPRRLNRLNPHLTVLGCYFHLASGEPLPGDRQGRGGMSAMPRECQVCRMGTPRCHRPCPGLAAWVSTLILCST